MIMQTIAQQLKKEGKKEERFETAKRMLLDNLSIEKVIKYTGLTEKEVKELTRISHQESLRNAKDARGYKEGD
jgi:predicted transposase YdaD